MVTNHSPSIEISAADIVECTGKQIDFDLELFVYRSLLERGYRCTHGGTYIDPVTEKPRQYDVRANYVTPVNWRIDLAIECKSLTVDNPLVVYRVPRPSSDSFHEVLVCDRNGSHVTKERSGLSLLYPTGGQVGKKTAQIRREPRKPTGFESGDSESFEKWSQALSSATDLVQNATTILTQMRRMLVPSFEPFRIGLVYVLPILVVSDSTLWAVDYSVDGAMQHPPLQVDEATLFVDRRYAIDNARDLRIGHLHLFTRTGFLNFIDHAVERSGPYFDRVFKFLIDRWGGRLEPH